MTPSSPALAAPGFGRRFWPVWLAGLAGIAALALQMPPAELMARSPELQSLSPPLLRLLLLLNPLLLMTLMALAGAAAAHRAGLRSYLAGTAVLPPPPRLGRQLLLAALGGAGLGLLLAVADRAAAPLLGAEWQAFLESANARPVAPDLLTGVLYGGLAEEVMLRWGVMSLLLAGLLTLGGPAVPGSAPVRTGLAIALAALAFAAAHLPALAMAVPLTGEVVLRTLALNTAAGLLYGWLFWRQGLEAAMAAHAGSHVAFALLRWLA